jgi:hypothetical protein
LQARIGRAAALEVPQIDLGVVGALGVLCGGDDRKQQSGEREK